MPLPSSDYSNPLINGLYTANADTTYVSPVTTPQQSWDFGADYFLPQNGAIASPMFTGPFAQMAEIMFKGLDFPAIWGGNGAGSFNFDFCNLKNSFIFNPSTSSSSSDSLSDKSELERVRAFLNKAVELTKEKDKKIKIKLEEQVLSDINDALDTIGSDEEKLEAMTAALESIPEDTRNQIVEAMNLDTLTEMGYQRFANDKTIKGKLTSIHDKLSVMTTKGNCDTDVVTNLITAVSGDSDKLLAAISAWNNDHNTSGCILGDIVSKITLTNLEESDKKSILEKQIHPLVEAMLNSAQSTISDLEDDGYSVSDLKTKRRALVNANEALTVTAFDNAKLDALVKAYKEMYVALRVNLAKQADDNIQEDYGFLNNDDKTLIKSTLITDATNTDLRSEGLSSIEVTAGEKEAEATDFSEMETDEALETLVENESLEAKTVGNKTYYVTKFGSNDSKRYYYKDGDVIKEIKNAKSIDASGNITFRGGAASQTIEAYITAQKDKDDNEVASEIIEETNKSLKILDELISEGRLNVHANNPDVFTAKTDSKAMISDKHWHYYAINSDGKLCEIKYKDNPTYPLSNCQKNTFNVWSSGSYTGTSEAKNYPDDFELVPVEKDTIIETMRLESEIAIPKSKQEFKDLGLKPVRMYKKSDVQGKNPALVDYSKGINCYKFNGKYYQIPDLNTPPTEVQDELYIPDENASPEMMPPQEDFTVEEVNARMQEIKGDLMRSVEYSSYFSYTLVGIDFVKKVLRYEKLFNCKLDFSLQWGEAYEQQQNSWGGSSLVPVNLIQKFLDEYDAIANQTKSIENYVVPLKKASQEEDEVRKIFLNNLKL